MNIYHKIREKKIKLVKTLKGILSDTQGATLVYFGLMLPIIMGFAGLGYDASMWYMEKRQIQSVADSAAITGAYSNEAGKTQQEIFDEVLVDLGENNFSLGDRNSISVITPPVTGKYVGNDKYVEITITRKAEMMFSGFLFDDQVSIQTRAVAGSIAQGDHCILALDHTMDKALEFSGSSEVDINCGVSSNSNSSESIYLNGTAYLSANPSAQAYGDIFEGDKATLDTPHPSQPFSQRSVDPYGPEGRNLQVPTEPSACYETGLSIQSGDPDPLPNKRYCDGISVSAGANVFFAPGIYIIDGGTFTINGNATISGTGVTFILTGTNPEDIATIRINGGADVNIVAPSTGDYKGIAFYQDQRAEYGDSNLFNGGADMHIKGAVYFPGQELDFSGGSDTVSGCLQLVGKKVTFSGNAFLNNEQDDCEFMGVEKISRILITLKE